MLQEDNLEEEILSARNNEQHNFHGDLNSQEGYSENSNITDPDIGDDKDYHRDSMHYDEQPLRRQIADQAKEDSKKKQIKVTCFDKAKGYMGFGTYLKSQKIGNIFFIPIPSEWKFKNQVILTQIIITIVAFSLYLGFSAAYYSSNRKIMNHWLVGNFKIQQEQLLIELNFSLETLIDASIEDSIEIINYTSRIVFDQISYPQVNLTWPQNQSFQIDSNIPKDQQALIIEDEGYYNQITYAFGTYFQLNKKQQQQQISLDERIINQYMNMNHLLPFQFNRDMGIVNRIYWKFNEEFILFYPGIIVNNASYFIDIVMKNFIIFNNNLNSSFNVIPVRSNSLNKKQSAFVSILINSQDNKSETLGIAYAELSLVKIEQLFKQLVGGVNSTFKLFMLNEENIILNNATERNRNFLDNNFLNVSTQVELEIMTFLSTKNNTYNRFSTLNGITYTQSSFIHSALRIKFIMFIFYNSQLLQYQQIVDNDDNQSPIHLIWSQYLPLIISVPLITMLISIFFLVKWIKPMQQITKIAYLSLKKNQKFNQEELEQIKGDGLIDQLSLLFKNLIVNLNSMKQDNKKQLCHYYSQKSYPKNEQVKDLERIRHQIEQIRVINVREKSLGSEPNRLLRYFNLLPNYDE